VLDFFDADGSGSIDRIEFIQMVQVSHISLSLSVPLMLSLSLTHTPSITHTHTHLSLCFSLILSFSHTQEITHGLSVCPSLPLSLPLSLTHTRTHTHTHPLSTDFFDAAGTGSIDRIEFIQMVQVAFFDDTNFTLFIAHQIHPGHSSPNPAYSLLTESSLSICFQIQPIHCPHSSCSTF
jgi:hypothetical protein